MVKPVKFTRDSGCPARDEFLVINVVHILAVIPATDVGRFAYKSIRIHRGRFAYKVLVDSHTSKSFRRHDLGRFAYIEKVQNTLKKFS